MNQSVTTRTTDGPDAELWKNSPSSFEQGPVGDRGQNQRNHSKREGARIGGPELIQPEPPLRAAERPISGLPG